MWLWFWGKPCFILFFDIFSNEKLILYQTKPSVLIHYQNMLLELLFLLKVCFYGLWKHNNHTQSLLNQCKILGNTASYRVYLNIDHNLGVTVVLALLSRTSRDPFNLSMRKLSDITYFWFGINNTELQFSFHCRTGLEPSFCSLCVFMM